MLEESLKTQFQFEFSIHLMLSLLITNNKFAKQNNKKRFNQNIFKIHSKGY